MKAIKFVLKLLVSLASLFLLGLAVYSFYQKDFNAGAYLVFGIMVGCLFIMIRKL